MSTKISELREMSDEQLEATLEETRKAMFRLRIKSQMERLDTPTELLKNRKLIARVKTVQKERELGLGE